jgi:hypothetical protein
MGCRNYKKHLPSLAKAEGRGEERRVENKVGSKDGVAGAGTLKAKPSWIFPYC